MICPKCKNTYDDKINICPECGTELIEESEFTKELDDKIEEKNEKIDENNKEINEKRTRSKAEIYKEQRKIMKEDEENYKKFIENEDSEAFGKLVERLVEHYKDKELEENYGWFRKYGENQRKIEENNKLINEKLKQLRANEEYIKSAEARIQDYKEGRRRVEQRINELKRLNEVKK